MNPLRILHLEDNDHDAELIAHEVHAAWPAADLVRVDGPAAYADALRKGGFDVILSDFALPGLDGFTAQRLAHELQPQVPFILVSGTIGEEKAVALLKAGAIDYVLKDRTARLISSIQRALNDVVQQRAQRAAEEARRETEERFRQLAESSSDVFWFADLDPFRVRYVSPAVEQIWGRPPEDFYADPGMWLTGVHPEDRGRVEQNFNAWLAGERLAFVEEFRVIRQDGTLRWVHDTGTFNPDPSGKIRRISGVVRDITLNKEAAEQSLRAQRLESIGLLAGGVAHDLNNALAPILMGLELMRPQVTAAQRPLFDQMMASGNRGAGMVRQLLGFARGAEGQKMVLDPRHAVREIEQLANSTFPKNIVTTVKFPAARSHLEIDPTLLHQVLLNLCVNARDAMPQGGALTLEVENTHVDESYAGFIRDAKPGAYVLLSVRDTGAGIPPEVLPKIFDPFFTTKPTGVGTGLGLTTVAGIAHNHGGFIRVTSEVGRGTTFKIYLPASLTGSTAPFAAPAADAEYHASGEGVLVVDDEEPVRALLKGLLERFGFHVHVATDGTEALAVFAGHRESIQLVITDERMPHMDGITLIRTLHHMAPQLRVIAMSGLHSERHAGEFAAQGVRHFLHKPFGLPELVRQLRDCLDAEVAQPDSKPVG